MGKVEKFKDLEVWQNTVELSISIYDILKNCRGFSFRDQICRASVSIAPNIAEGFERQYNKEFIQFLYIAKGSAAEVRTQLYIGQRLQYFKDDDYHKLHTNIEKIARQLFNLIKIRKDKF